MSSTLRGLASLALVKKESSYLTDPTPTGTADAVRFVSKPSIEEHWQYDGNRGPVNTVGAGNYVRQTPKGRWASGTIETSGRGRGAAYTSSSVTVPDTHALLQMSGFDPVVTTTGGSEKWTMGAMGMATAPYSATVWKYVNGTLWKVNGAYATLTITGDGIGIPVWKFDYNGVLASITDASLPGSYGYLVPTVIPPAATNIAFTLGNFTAGRVRSFTFTQNRSIDEPRVNQNATDGHYGFTPGRWDPELQVVLEATALQGSPYHASAGIDPYTLVANATSGLACSLTVGGQQYNKWKLASAQVQVTATPFENPAGNASLWRLTIKPYVSDDGANDDFYFEFP